jgi:hypothetical protein
VVLWGHCDGALRAHLVAHGVADRVLDRVTRRVICVQGRPQLRAEGEGGAFTFTLDEPVSLLQGWLPDAMAPSSARAVFTGRRLIVATVRDGLSLQSYVCRGDELVSEPAPLL